MKSQVDIKSFAKDIIRIEKEAIENLIGFVDDRFVEVIELLYNCKGRIVVTGIGKSAIIGSKIVATLNSTGTPAVFMHAADAIHGDLGMIQRNDIVICISKSGNTPEIKVLIPLIRNIDNNNVIIGMVGNMDSYLAENCDYVINTYVSHEACPNNLAPTASTTAQLVMGDAIAMSLLKMKGITAADFAKIHPGGSLGKRLYIKVSDLVEADSAPQVRLDAALDEVIIEISSKRLGATAVLDDEDNIRGIITDGDLRRMLQKKVNINKVAAKDIMSTSPQIIDKDSLAVNAFARMEAKKITQLLVVDEHNRYVGIIHVHAILQEGVV